MKERGGEKAGGKTKKRQQNMRGEKEEKKTELAILVQDIFRFHSTPFTTVVQLMISCLTL